MVVRGADALHHAAKVERKDICVHYLTVLCDEYGLDLGTPTRKRPKRSQEGVRPPRYACGRRGGSLSASG